MRFIVMAALLAVPLTQVHAGDGVRVTLVISGLASSDGQVLVSLYASEDGFPTKPDKARLKLRAPATSPVTTVTFEHVPPGRWAGFAVHDLDGDDQVDVARIIPIPKEPVGATRDAKGRFGPPSFTDASFTVGAVDVVERFRVVSL